MYTGWAIVTLNNGNVNKVRVYSELEDARKILFQLIKDYLDENPDFKEFLVNIDQDFINAIDGDDIYGALDAYFAMEWREEDEFVLEECEIND